MAAFGTTTLSSGSGKSFNLLLQDSVLFYQEMPPEFDINPPYIGYKGVDKDNMHYNLLVTYFMYGSSSIRVYAGGRCVKVIENPCGKWCSFHFVTTRVTLNRIPYCKGKKFQFLVVFNTTKPGDFIVIDKTEVQGVNTLLQTTPAPCACRPCEAVLEDNSPESLEGYWQIPSESLWYYKDIEDIESALGEILPPAFSYKTFEGAEGVWVALNNTDNTLPLSPSGPPFFWFHGGDKLDFTEITCYLHGSSSLSVFTGDSLEPAVLRNEDGEEKWLAFRIDLNGTDKFRVEMNVTEDGHFAFIDRIFVRRSGCPISKLDVSGSGNTTVTEICGCPINSSTTTELERVIDAGVLNGESCVECHVLLPLIFLVGLNCAYQNTII